MLNFLYILVAPLNSAAPHRRDLISRLKRTAYGRYFSKSELGGAYIRGFFHKRRERERKRR